RPMFFQFLPPSVDLYTPSPQETELRGLFSPVPTQTMSRLDGATATSPMETVASLSNWCSKEMPLLVVLSRPPEAVATHQVEGSARKTARATVRPPIDAGPRHRQRRALAHCCGRVGSIRDCWEIEAEVGACSSAVSFFCSSAICCLICEICSSRLLSFS